MNTNRPNKEIKDYKQKEIDTELCESARRLGWSCFVDACKNNGCNKDNFECFVGGCTQKHKKSDVDTLEMKRHLRRED